MKRIGFIDLYLDEWHAEQYPGWIEQATAGEMKVSYAYAKQDAENGVDNASWCKARDIELLDSIEAVVEKSDYLIVLSPDNPEAHLELATYPLTSGKPTYVDKTFAPDGATARLLFDTADKHGTPVFSSSALRFATEYNSIRKAGIKSIVSVGPGNVSNYLIHQLEPIVALLGTRATRVMSLGNSQAPIFAIHFADGAQAVVHHVNDTPFSLLVHHGSGTPSLFQAQSDYFAEFTLQMTEFFRTGVPPVDKNQTIAICTIIESALKSLQTPFQWIETRL